MDSFTHFLAENITQPPPGEAEWREAVLEDLSTGNSTSLLVYADWLEDNGGSAHATALRGTMLTLLHDVDNYLRWVHFAHTTRRNSPVGWAEIGQLLENGDWSNENYDPPRISLWPASSLHLDDDNDISTFMARRVEGSGSTQIEHTVRIWMTDRSVLPEWVSGWLMTLAGVEH